MVLDESATWWLLRAWRILYINLEIIDQVACAYLDSLFIIFFVCLAFILSSLHCLWAGGYGVGFNFVVKWLFLFLCLWPCERVFYFRGLILVGNQGLLLFIYWRCLSKKTSEWWVQSKQLYPSEYEILIWTIKIMDYTYWPVTS